MHNVAVPKRLKCVEITQELAQRSACDQLKSDQENSSGRRHAGCGKLLGRPLGPLYIVKHIAIHIILIVAWPEPEPLWSNGTPAYWVLPESSCHCENDSHIVLRPKRMNNGKREKRLSTLYLELLFILDFGFFSEWFLFPSGSYAPCSTVIGTLSLKKDPSNKLGNSKTNCGNKASYFSPSLPIEWA